jgi:hypothetical protein
MHVSDEPQILIETSDVVKVEGSMLMIRVPIPQSLWTTVTLEQVRNYQTAIDIYFSQVLFPESGEIRSSQIVLPVA